MSLPIRMEANLSSLFPSFLLSYDLSEGKGLPYILRVDGLHQGKLHQTEQRAADTAENKNRYKKSPSLPLAVS